MDPAQRARQLLMRLASSTGPDDATSVADARAALGLASGVSPDDISPLGYDHSGRAYRDFRASWIAHITMHGWTEHDKPWLDEVMAVWRAAQPDLAADDDWVGAAVAGHLASWPARCRRGDSCLICCRYRRWPMAEIPAPARGSGSVHCCGGHRERCLFGHQHRWSTWFHDGRLQRTTLTFHCDLCDGVCTAEETETSAGERTGPS